MIRFRDEANINPQMFELGAHRFFNTLTFSRPARHKENDQQGIDYLLSALELAQNAGDQGGTRMQMRDTLLLLAQNYHAHAAYDLPSDQKAAEFQQAVDTYEKALDINGQLTEEMDPQKNFNEAGILNGLGVSITALGNCPVAIEKLQQALAIYESINNDDGIASAKYNLGKCGVTR